MERFVGLLGLVVMVLAAWLLSSNRARFPWRVVTVGIVSQFAFAVFTLRTTVGFKLFEQAGEFFETLLGFVTNGSALLFTINPEEGDAGLPPGFTLLRTFAFGVLPTIIFFSALMSVLYHVGLMQLVVGGLAWVMRRTLGTSGAETLSAAANIFVGQTEAPLVIRPYVARMTSSELMVVMVGGFATIAGGVMAIYVQLGIDAAHLLTASVISAPAALLIAKVMEPESGEPETGGKDATRMERTTSNLFEAAAEGASAGMMLALNVAAMLIAFTALVAMCNALVGMLGGLCGFEKEAAWTLQKGFGYALAPVAWLMGITWDDCYRCGQLLGERTVLNEFIAYLNLSEIVKTKEIGERSITILTYALCGFANFSSIGIQIGGIGAIAPTRRGDLARLGLRAMIGGTLASFMTACVAGMLL
ncbi:MAG: NupC/NupG family nucleoside CNT transporter [Lacipirellulaceae bacterium]